VVRHSYTVVNTDCLCELPVCHTVNALSQVLGAKLRFVKICKDLSAQPVRRQSHPSWGREGGGGYNHHMAICKEIVSRRRDRTCIVDYGEPKCTSVTRRLHNSWLRRCNLIQDAKASDAVRADSIFIAIWSSTYVRSSEVFDSKERMSLGQASYRRGCIPA